MVFSRIGRADTIPPIGGTLQHRLLSTALHICLKLLQLDPLLAPLSLTLLTKLLHQFTSRTYAFCRFYQAFTDSDFEFCSARMVNLRVTAACLEQRAASDLR